MKNFYLIFIIMFCCGCVSNNIVENLKHNLSAEEKVKVYNKSFQNRNKNIPHSGMIIVKQNETIYTIANKYNVVPKDIINDNKLTKPYFLKKNQIIFLRNKAGYIVKYGDTIETISLRFAVLKSDLIKLNKLKKPYNINVGDKIFIPKKKNYSVIDQLVDEKVYSLKSEIKKNQSFNNKIIKDSPKFIWPAKGILIKKFGKLSKGQHYDGIDLKIGNEVPIYSSQSGKVAFVGSHIKKFGNMILLKHDDGWLTAYSNVGKYNVKQGDMVNTKQIIAYSREDRDSFHFQIRYNRTPVNPVNYLN